MPRRVVSYKSPEWSGPDEHRHGGFRLFFTLFPGRGEWSPDSEATFKHYHIRKWIASQFREQAVLDELPGEANLDRSPEERKVRKRKKKRHLIYMIFGMSARRDLIICSLYSEHLHITRSWLWLKQNLLVSVDTDISQCLPPVSLSTLHTSSWQLLHWINHDYWLTCTQQSAQAQPELCFLSAKLI